MRKFILTLTFLPFLTLLHAQETPTFTVDSLLVNVDMSSLSTGMLYDRTMELGHLDHFNDSINMANTGYFEQALLELRKASLDQKLTDYKELRTFYTPDSLMNVVDIGILNANFQKLNYNEADESLGALRMTPDSLLERIENNQPMFLDHHTFMVAPLKEYLMGTSITYKFDPNFLLQDTSNKNLVSLMANFDTNTNYTLFENGAFTQSEIEIPYSEEGYKMLIFTATFQDGSTKTTQGMLHLKLPVIPTDPLMDDFDIWGSIPWQGFNESAPHTGKLHYRIFYHTNNGNTLKKLLKPIVIIDGFDPGDKRKIQDSDSPLPPNKHRSIEEMMSYQDANGGTINLIPILRNLGYDVVIVNQVDRWDNGYHIDGGADYIERNALTHVALYNRLNTILTQNGCNEQLVIVGPSMGGQISRYALAYMEKEGIPHNTRLWISIDSPHLGANIPMGIQSLLNTVYGDSPEAQEFVDKELGSPAAKQQLIEQFSGWTNSILRSDWLDGRTTGQGFYQDRGRPIYVNYYNHSFNNGLPGSQGYPQNLRKIALVNGSLKYKKAFYNPYEPLGTEFSNIPVLDQFSGSGFQTLKIKGYSNGIGHTTTLESYFMPHYNDNHKISFAKKRFPGGWHTYDRYITNINSRGNMDNVPGGWFSSQRDLADAILNSTPCEWFIGQICINNWSVETLEHVNSFIPAVSALGFYNPNFNWDATLNRNLVCTGEIPFDSYFGPKVNEQHTSFTQESVDWLLEELAGNPQPPTVYYNESNLEGPNAVCYGSVATYEFPSCTPLPVTTWESSSNIDIVIANDFSITVEANNSSSGPGFIKAIFPNNVVEKNIWVNEPLTPAYLNGPEIVNTATTVHYDGGIAEGANSYEWWLPYPFEVVAPFDYFGPNWQVYPNAGKSTSVFTGNAGNNGYVQLMGKNECGLGGAKILSVVHGAGGGGQNQLPVYPYPNSSDDSFHLDFSSYSEGNYEIYIYDAYSNTLYQGSSSNIDKTISTLDIPEGNYFLHIHLDSEVLQYQLLIGH
ncbi:MAG TPA: hypothetical protein PKW08_02160 [Flavobacteriaceae bacterium]|nr:T9SS type A sorting domain-containing protein [Flavobacteriaceae bacterium]HPF10888.1 hypothetical protein [Flavobacteriaceae bacterium]HQU20369.1 hypothetical protein [Flavobacteriaceae bacterium]HQU64261.1 hypothetical protein [Flavobacteriaceae bacterium]HRW44272.1 hypothetical protein [Flavobacteriaceae bacterium]